MKKVLSKKQVVLEIEEFFRNISKKTPKEVKKIKRLAMSYKIPLKEKRKLFCKKCFSPYVESGIRVKKGHINITCSHCHHISRWRIK
jgi:RNase P subunit RPR2